MSDLALADRLPGIRSGLGYDLDALKKSSMLHTDTLALLTHFARISKGAVLEIGPYIGGSTIAIGKGLRPGRSLVTVELGGSYDHPQLPSPDILGDLRKNLAAAGVEAKICEGWLYNAFTLRNVVATLGGEKVGLLVIDADGFLGATFSLLAEHLRPDCLIVLDDYSAPEHETEGDKKVTLVSAFVDRHVAAGDLTTLGVFKWGTWFGRLNGRGPRDRLAASDAGGVEGWRLIAPESRKDLQQGV